jgi:hypothetical protein
MARQLAGTLTGTHSAGRWYPASPLTTQRGKRGYLPAQPARNTFTDKVLDVKFTEHSCLQRLWRTYRLPSLIPHLQTNSDIELDIIQGNHHKLRTQDINGAANIWFCSPLIQPQPTVMDSTEFINFTRWNVVTAFYFTPTSLTTQRLLNRPLQRRAFDYPVKPTSALMKWSIEPHSSFAIGSSSRYRCVKTHFTYRHQVPQVLRTSPNSLLFLSLRSATDWDHHHPDPLTHSAPAERFVSRPSSLSVLLPTPTRLHPQFNARHLAFEGPQRFEPCPSMRAHHSSSSCSTMTTPLWLIQLTA